MRYFGILLALMLTGCPEPMRPAQITPVTRVTTNPIPEASSEGSYELELVTISPVYDDAQNAVNIRQLIQTWLENHRNRKVVSIVPVPSYNNGSGNNCLTHLIIVSEPK